MCKSMATLSDSRWTVRRKCDQLHPCGFVGRLKINVMQGDSIDHSSRQPNRLLQRAGSQPASLSVPEIAGIKLPHLECTDVQYQQSFCRLKSFIQYELINTDNAPPPPHHSLLDTKQYRPWAIDPDWSQIWAGDRLMLLPKQLKALTVCLYGKGGWEMGGGGYQHKHGGKVH